MLKLVTPGHFKMKVSKVSDLRNLNSPSIVQYVKVLSKLEEGILVTLELHEEEIFMTNVSVIGIQNY